MTTTEHEIKFSLVTQDNADPDLSWECSCGALCISGDRSHFRSQLDAHIGPVEADRLMAD